MTVEALFGLSALLGLIASGLVAALYVWRPLRALPRENALRVLAVLRVAGDATDVAAAVGTCCEST